MERKISGKRYNNVEALKKVLEKSWAEMTMNQCAIIIANFPTRFKKYIETQEGKNILKFKNFKYF